MTTAVGFANKMDAAVSLIARVVGIKLITTAAQFEAAKLDHKMLIQYENDLDDEYNALPEVVAAKKAQATRKDLATKLDAAKKGLKNGPMWDYEKAEAAKRLAEERRLQKIAEEAVAAENARILAEQKKEFDRLEKIRKAAEKQGDEEAAAAAAAMAATVKADAIEMKANPLRAATVVVEKTAPSMNRRMVPKFRVFNETIIPREYFSRDDVKIGGVVRSLRANHGIPGIEYYEDPA